ncbi:hypothetical protein DL98DRAFT_112395 [Cadophora sp. DSE1049]|nr:hypothetical protein DL98DRAFT_112395 [Cadophora sp. DSE1049]
MSKQLQNRKTRKNTQENFRAPLPDGEHDWPNVLVIGEHKQNPDEDRSAKNTGAVSRICTRSVWKSTGAAIHAWVLDLRKHDAALGIRQAWTVQLREVDIHKEPERYVKVLAD